jgi:hypothetical protein
MFITNPGGYAVEYAVSVRTTKAENTGLDPVYFMEVFNIFVQKDKGE